MSDTHVQRGQQQLRVAACSLSTAWPTWSIQSFDGSAHYEEFFGLRARPFGITPSADLFFHSSAHRRTLAYLQGQALAGEPLIVLTGSAGKTTVRQAFLRNLSDNSAPAVLVSTQLDKVELTRSVLIAFGAAATGGSLDDLRTALRSRLEELRSHPQRGLLLVDEAQNLSAETLRYLM